MKITNKVTKWIAFAVAAFMIVAMMPRNGKFLNNFSVGQRWNHSTLTAPFDMPIYKSANELSKNIEDIEKHFIPVYALDQSVEAKALYNIEKNFADLQNLDEIKHAIDFVYSKGVSSVDVASGENIDQSLKLIRIKHDTIMDRVSVDEIFTVETAITYLHQKFPNISLSNYVSSNLVYDKTLSARLKELERNRLSRTKGVISQDEIIVSNGQVIDDDTFVKLNSLKVAYEESFGGHIRVSTSLGYYLIVSLLLALSYTFLFYFRHEFSEKLRNSLFLLSIYVVMVGVSVAINRLDWISIYIIPLTIVPIYVMTFFDIRMSIFEFVISLLLCALVVSKPFEFLVINFTAGIVGVFILRNYYIRGRVFFAAACMFVTYCLTYICMQLIQGSTFADISYWNLIWFVVNVLLFLGLYQLTYVIERLFGFVSDITLLELCDTNHALLLDLSHKAPGTFQHSLQVANLAEAAAKAIGANALLARTGALYHDIGKINAPEYFIENSVGGYNPHDDLSPTESVAIIKAHVTDGLALAKKEGLPSVVTEFINSHHGNSLIFFFYSAQQKLTGTAISDSDFRYDGARPVSKEATICMICDAVEAASRSLDFYTAESISDLVDKIVDIQLDDKQYNDSLMSMNEIGIVKDMIKGKLSNIYHTRIAYPERETLNKNEIHVN